MPQKLMLPVKRLITTRKELLNRRHRPREDAELEHTVNQIVEKVRKEGDKALLHFSKQFDGVDLSVKGLTVQSEAIIRAYEQVSEDQRDALAYLKRRIQRVEEKQRKQIAYSIIEDGLTISRISRPIPSVGCYVPGGRAAYPSTLLMSVVPAMVAGVPRIVVCSPPTAHGEIDPLILVAADICNVDEIYRIGGAQAIAALAFGTESIDPVKKIVGPGNRFVTLAKALVSRTTSVDYPYGPSELLVIADETTDARYVAVDLISQAEHAPDNTVGLLTPSEQLAQRVVVEIQRRLKTIERRNIIVQSLTEKGFILVSEDLVEAIDFINAFAPEHLQIMTQNAGHVVEKIMSAGVILVGPYTPAAGSDYCFGTNHILPTEGFSQVYSGLSMLDFVTRINVVECSRKRLKKFEAVAQTLAISEGLPNHGLALTERRNG